MSKPSMVFVESNTTGTGRLFVRAAVQRGFRPVLLTSDPAQYDYLHEQDLTVVTIDTSDQREVLDVCTSIKEGGGLVGIGSSSEYFAVTAAHVARKLKLPGTKASAIREARDKNRQRTCLGAAGIRIPQFRTVTSPKSAEAAAAELGPPVVVKPISGSGSVGVKLCADRREAAEHASFLLGQRTNERGLPAPRRVLVEEYVGGAEFSVEILSGKVIGITRKHLGELPHFVEIGHDFPADIPRNDRRALRSLGLEAVEALGLDFGPAHVEIRLGDDGPTVIEVNPRLAGGLIPELVRLAMGIDLISEIIGLLAGESLPPLKPSNGRRYASIRFLLTPADGSISAIQGLDQAAKVPKVIEARVYREVGDSVQRLGNFRDRVGHVIACAPDPGAAQAAAVGALGCLELNVDQGGQAIKQIRASDDTGRIARTLKREAADIVFGVNADASIDAELRHITQVDRAHLIMLAEEEIVDERRVAALLNAIESLRKCDFLPLKGRRAPRGLYMLYENYLIDTLGAEVGGILQTGRSRNDLAATTFRLRLREPYKSLLLEALAVQGALLQKARDYSDTVMPAFTHYQAAVPITYGHYLGGVASAMGRDIAGLLEAGSDLSQSPLGAASGGGTSFPINTSRTAELLGFDSPTINSLDATASRDMALRILAATAILGVTLSRLATDLLQWLSSESKLLSLPDELVGSSSLMPQKRNPFLLEHVQGRSAAPLGALVAAATAMNKTPFTNSVAVGTEAVSQIWDSMRNVEEACRLARLVVVDCKPDCEAMMLSAVEGRTSATALADRLVRELGLSFREAHRSVGTLIRKIEDGQPPQSDQDGWAAPGSGKRISSSLPDPASVVQATAYGGGPAPSSLEAGLARIDQLRDTHMSRLTALEKRWLQADGALDREVKRVRREGKVRA